MNLPAPLKSACLPAMRYPARLLPAVGLSDFASPAESPAAQTGRGGASGERAAPPLPSPRPLGSLREGRPGRPAPWPLEGGSLRPSPSRPLLAPWWWWWSSSSSEGRKEGLRRCSEQLETGGRGPAWWARRESGPRRGRAEAAVPFFFSPQRKASGGAQPFPLDRAPPKQLPWETLAHFASQPPPPAPFRHPSRRLSR